MLFGGWLLASFLGSIAVGAIVRNRLALGQGFWVVEPELFIRHDQNLNLSLPVVLTVTAFLAVLLAAASFAVARAGPESPGLLLVVFGVGAGGILANATEALTLGSVTDFLAIRASGVFS